MHDKIDMNRITQINKYKKDFKKCTDTSKDANRCSLVNDITSFMSVLMT